MPRQIASTNARSDQEEAGRRNPDVRRARGPRSPRGAGVARRRGAVRIRVQAFAVKPTDTRVRAGQRDSSQTSPPYVPGMDAAGVIDEMGPDVTGW